MREDASHEMFDHKRTERGEFFELNSYDRRKLRVKKMDGIGKRV